jgi:hypothetical protein
MNDKQLFQALEKIINENTVNKIKNTAVIKEGDQYRLFEKYIVKKTKVGFQVTRISDDNSKLFTSIKYAVTWATLDKRNLIVEANRVLQLDDILAGLEVSTKLLEKYNKKTQNFIYLNKLNENRLKRVSLIKELDSYTVKAKQWQMTQFAQSSYK